jgi:hypothetical protein
MFRPPICGAKIKGGSMKRFTRISFVALAIAVSLGLMGCTALVNNNNGDATTGFSGDITSAVTWSSDTYVSGDVNITSTGSLTISPGVTVTLNSDVYIYVATGGTLNASGTSAKPIAFKPKNANTNWRHIDFAGSGNVMNYCTVTGAGYNAGYYAIVFSTSGAQADIENCSIYSNLAGGIDASYARSGTVIKSNAFYSNARFGIIANDNVDLGSYLLVTENTYTKTGYTTDLYNDISFTGDISSARVFDVTEVPYFFGGDVNIKNLGSLTVMPSVKIDFDTDVYLYVDAGGILDAEGTDDTHQVIFEGKSNNTYWRHIDFGGTGNIMKYCKVTGAGYNAGYYALTFASTGQAGIEHCNITGNLAGGIDAQYAAAGTFIYLNTFSANNSSLGGPYYDINISGNANVQIGSGNGPIGIVVN